MGWAEKFDHSLTDICPDVVELISMMEDILTLESSESEGVNDGQYAHDHTIDALNGNSIDERRQRAKEILSHFQAMSWYEGIRIAFACNRNLISLIGVQLELFPTLLSLLAHANDGNCAGTTFGHESIFAILLRCPGALGVD